MNTERYSSFLGAAVRVAMLGGARVVVASATAILAAPMAVSASEMITKQCDFDIPAQSLESALLQISRQADVQMMVGSTALAGQNTVGLKGKLSTSEALIRLLSNSGLTFETVGNTVTVRPVAVAATNRAVFPLTGSAVLASSQASSAKPVNAGAVELRGGRTEEGSESDEPLAEIVVTGTHIRGAAPVGSPLLQFDNVVIDQSGYSSVDRFFDSIPQNFGGGGFSQDISTTAAGNMSAGTGINLRGLGADATLVLLNGHRLPWTGLNGSFVDISGIPLGAIERIDLMPDGASAIYGSDAVGGVVNFVLKKQFDGIQVDSSYGIASDHSAPERRASITVGQAWSSGHLLASFEHYDRAALAAADRPFTANADLRPFGGSDFRSNRSNPGTIVVPGIGTFGIPTGQNGMGLTEASLIAGVPNKNNTQQALDILPEQDRQSALFTLEQDISPSLSMGVDLFAVRREAERHPFPLTARITVPQTNAFRALNNLFPGRTLFVDYAFRRDLGERTDTSETKTSYAVLRANWNMGRDWSMDIHAAGAREDTDQSATVLDIANLNAALADSNIATAFNPFGDGSFTNPATLARIRGRSAVDQNSKAWSTGIALNGPIWELPSGIIKGAFGFVRREEEFSVVTLDISGGQPQVAPYTNGDRSVGAAYGELFIPLLGSRDGSTIWKDLNASVAARYERYSDFGSTTNPKLGLEWRPTAWLALRGSRGTSFKAPSLSQLDNVNSVGAAFSSAGLVQDPDNPSQQLVSLALFGGNPNLKEQTADTTTFGIELRPTNSSSINLGYFQIDYRDRISAITVDTAVLLRASLYPQLIDRTPDVVEVQRIISSAPFSNSAGISSPSEIQVVIDGRTTNLARTKVDGFDLTSSYAVSLPNASLQFGINAAYLRNFRQAAFEDGEFTQLIDTFGNPSNFRGRASIGWERGPLSIDAAVNYVDGYHDLVSSPNREVGSWTTTDLHLSYRWSMPSVGKTIKDLTTSLAVSNLFNVDPPFVNNTNRIAYDPNNADPLGRYFTARLGLSF